MIWSKTSKEKERYYLFAGMGGRASRRRRMTFLAWALVAAALVSAALTIFLLFENRLRVD